MILMYHKIHPNSPTMWWVTVDDFYRQMSELSNKKVVYLDDYEIGNEEHVVITFDGIYKNVLEFALPILKHFNYPFELFLTSDYLGLDNEFDKVEPNAPFTTVDELKALVAGGGRLQWHTQSHPNLKNVFDNDIIKKELSIPLEVRLLDDKGFNWFAYPHGEYNDEVLKEVKENFKGALSCNQGNDLDKYVLNRLTVVNKTILRENKIACIIASYNYGDFLIEAVESVLKQTVVPNEILISDDCSSDETQLIAESYVKKYPDLIKYNRNETNLGIVKHFNKAISLTKSDYIVFLGADNRLLSNYIEKCAEVLDKDDDIAIAYTDYALFGSRAKLVYNSFDESKKGEIINDSFYQIVFPCFDDRNSLFQELKKGNFIHGSSMFKRKAFVAVGGYIETKKAEDYNLFYRIIEKGYHAEKVRDINLEYRQHSFGQANNVVSIHNKLNFYRTRYTEKHSFEKSRYYKLAFLIFKIVKTPKSKLFKKLLKKIFK
ncbi:glycosyltransferase [Flavobacterium sp.]|uniref:glycosyltransferase n=1 Tax=Flavobacterium sp. TaxID=239 RepID=UPI0040475528